MSSEQKEIFSVLSRRQLIYILVFGVIAYQYVQVIWKIFYPINAILALIICGISLIPSGVIVGVLGFYYKYKYFMYFDRYLIVRFARKNQYGKWRKGA